MSLPSSYLGHLDISEFYLEVGKTGATQLMAEEMARRYSSAHCSTEMIKTEMQTINHSVGHLTRYNWSAEVFPRMMEERGFHRNKSDGLKEFHYR